MRQPIGSSFLESEKGSGLGTWAQEGRGTMKKEKKTRASYPYSASGCRKRSYCKEHKVAQDTPHFGNHYYRKLVPATKTFNNQGFGLLAPMDAALLRACLPHIAFKSICCQRD